ncbi:MAG: hypothetical protein E6586_07240 [Bifidobacterium scardovii]|uniref:hypothetical protein n=1 Tax=Bifidobacterium scardovii TaxID=158787 RepID=UPI000AE91A8E|nr:hypothetical protein [Bifidobacterium scardovii]MBS6948741.1 hypothetical protein [Bifidobacterium scardovii]MDU3737248.1 hypothetical protein [Bifidobacterium scardovii]MDU5296981.1 hypothetical protein [Bifidobacterium scardovii]MDU5611454.1 hypothetical protein [Bifidobacterium scardovii]MDU5887205.1 hypothetical protein [Bifidobacterium scardovii]
MDTIPYNPAMGHICGVCAVPLGLLADWIDAVIFVGISTIMDNCTPEFGDGSEWVTRAKAVWEVVMESIP